MAQLTVNPKSKFQNVFIQHVTAFPIGENIADPVKITYWDRYAGLTMVDSYVLMAIFEGVKGALKKIV